MESDKSTSSGQSDPSIYFAPMEGITGHVYRSAHAKHFSGIEKYYLPFIAAHETHAMKNKEKKDVSPAQNFGLCAVPQVLTKSADDFLWALNELTSLGYREINYNLGCPSPTVTSKGKGAAFLGQPDELDRFFEEVFENIGRYGNIGTQPEKDDLRITVKTRIGVEAPDEWDRIFAIYNRYPISELIVHARTMREFYGGDPHVEIFEEILRSSRIPVCYNGNIQTVSDYTSIQSRFGGHSMFSGVMIGRGLIKNPALAQEITGGEPLSGKSLLAFHDKVLAGYQEELSGDAHVISKMKELWRYMGPMFKNAEKPLKRVKKAKTVREYQAAVREVISCGIDRNVK